MTERLHFTFHFHALEKEIATHSSVLAWRIPGMGEPGRLPSMGRTESDTTEATWQQQQQKIGQRFQKTDFGVECKRVPLLT